MDQILVDFAHVVEGDAKLRALAANVYKYSGSILYHLRTKYPRNETLRSAVRRVVMESVVGRILDPDLRSEVKMLTKHAGSVHRWIIDVNVAFLDLALRKSRPRRELSDKILQFKCDLGYIEGGPDIRVYPAWAATSKGPLHDAAWIDRAVKCRQFYLAKYRAALAVAPLPGTDDLRDRLRWAVTVLEDDGNVDMPDDIDVTPCHDPCARVSILLDNGTRVYPYETRHVFNYENGIFYNIRLPQTDPAALFFSIDVVGGGNVVNVQAWDVYDTMTVLFQDRGGLYDLPPGGVQLVRVTAVGR